jgi:hypothetical protein
MLATTLLSIPTPLHIDRPFTEQRGRMIDLQQMPMGALRHQTFPWCALGNTGPKGHTRSQIEYTGFSEGPRVTDVSRLTLIP